MIEIPKSLDLSIIEGAVAFVLCLVALYIAIPRGDPYFVEWEAREERRVEHEKEAFRRKYGREPLSPDYTGTSSLSWNAYYEARRHWMRRGYSQVEADDMIARAQREHDDDVLHGRAV